MKRLGSLPAEVASRTTQAARRLQERWVRLPAAGQQVARALSRAPELGVLARPLARQEPAALQGLLAWARRHAEGTFVVVPGEREQLAAVIRERFPHDYAAVLREAEGALKHEVPLLGLGTIKLGDPIPWQADPATGRPWPRRRWWQIRYLRAEPGDAKFVWELNRLRPAVALARAWWLTGEERYAREAVTMACSCLAANPPGWGVNWASSLEVAMRALALLWVYHLCLPAAAMTPQAHLELLAGFLASGRHLLRYPSTHTSPNTHLIGEATALWAMGQALPALQPAARWQAVGKRMLDVCLDQVLPDGGHVELSTHYHRYALEYYQLACALAARHGDPPPAWLQAISRMTDWALALATPEGWVERLGDSDGGSAAFAPDRAEGDYRHVFACSAALLGRSGPSRAVAAEACWLCGPAAAGGVVAPARSTTILPHSGLLVLHDERMQVIFDCGRHGGLGGGHAHADALALTMTVNGRPTLSDRGTYRYTGEPAWRNYFRGTSAHNTVTVDDASQAQPTGPFAWGQVAAVRLLHWADGLAHAWACGECLARYPTGRVTHRRVLFLLKGYYLLVADRLEGEGQHRLSAHWHLAPGQESKPGWGMTTLWPGSRASLLEGGDAPGPGWHSDLYGRRQPAPTVRVEQVANLPQVIHTLFWAGEPVTGELQDDGSLLVSGSWGSDLIACEPALSYVRLHGQAPASLGLSRGRQVQGRDCLLLECAGTVDYLHADLTGRVLHLEVVPRVKLRMRTVHEQAVVCGQLARCRREGEWLLVEDGP